MGKTVHPQWLLEEVKQYEIPLKEAPKTVLDIGANTGAFSELAAAKWPEARIVAYEPLSESAEPDNRIERHVAAVRSFSGTSHILIGNCPTTHSFHDLGRQTDKTVSVECVDAATLESAEFVKIDTEGCEAEILSHLDLTATKAIALEYHSDADKALICSLLEDNGFVPYRNYYCGKGNGVLRYVRKGVELQQPKPKLFIALPIYFHIDPHFFRCAMKLMAEFSVNCKVQPFVGDSLIPRCRNTISRAFLQSDCTHLLMIDSDLVFSNDHIKRILSHDEDVVGGFYPKKKEGSVDMVCNALEPQPDMDERRLTSLKYIGSGFLCISRRVLEKMIEVYGEQIAYTHDDDGKTIEHDFWSVGVYRFPDGTKRYLSEDWYFCQRALDLGFKVYGDNGITLRHSGNALYPLQHQLEQQKIFSRSSTDSAVAETEAVSPRLPFPTALTT